MTLQIGMVGTGDFSRKHAQILAAMEGVKIRAVCSTSKEKADRMAAEYGARGYGQLRDMLDGERLDAIYICVIPKAHGEIEKQLIERNIPFFVEKPIGLDAGIPREIAAQIRKTSLITSVGYHFRYQPTTQRLKEWVGQQNLGMTLGYYMGDLPRKKPWWRKQDHSGGQWNEQTTHIVDLLRYIAGEVEEVHAWFDTRLMHKKLEEVTVPDVGTVNLKLRNGTIANISNTCVLPRRVLQAGIRFYTDRGIFGWDPHGLHIESDGDFPGRIENTENPYVRENEAFIHAVRTQDTSRILSDYEDALKTQTVISAALESARKGTAVSVVLP